MDIRAASSLHLWLKPFLVEIAIEIGIDIDFDPDFDSDCPPNTYLQLAARYTQNETCNPKGDTCPEKRLH